VGSKKRGKEQALQHIAEADVDAEVSPAVPSVGPPSVAAPEAAGSANGPVVANAAPAGAAQPEEIKGSVELRITDHVTLRATIRTTPTGLIGAATLLAAVLVPVMWGRRPR
jgi:hypothetical protein